MKILKLGILFMSIAMVSSANAGDVVSFGSSWSYLNPQTTAESPSTGNFDTTWFTSGFDDAAWTGPSPGPFTRGTPEKPDINAFTPGNRNYVRDAQTFLAIPETRERHTAYFRHEFTTAADTTDLAIEMLADDGARIYLDGEEIYSFNCCRNDDGTVAPGTPTTYTDLANAAGSEREYTLSPVLVGENLAAGDHVLAVAIHQSSNRSSDMGFSMRLMDDYVYRPFITEFSDGWQYFEGESEPTDGTLDWTAVDFEARGWDGGQDGFGYDTNETDNVLPYVNTELLDMQEIFSSVYIRKPFSVSNLDEIGELQLTIDYDDAFVAYINGTEVVRAGADGEVGVSVPFDSLGTSHESTNANGNPADLFTISLSDHPDLLNDGDGNVLAIHGINQALDSSDFLLGRIGLAGVEGAPTGIPGDFDADGDLDAADIDALSAAVRDGNTSAEFDLNGDGAVDAGDRAEWVNVIKNTYFGDSNMDGEFGTPDFVAVFTAGEYEDSTPGNSTWATGDWNGDGDFGTPDFVAAFSAGGYEKGPREGGPNVAAVPEPTSMALFAIGLLALAGLRRR